MSVLSSPQGTPERVWSLVAGLSALGGECEREVFDALLNPGYTREGSLVQAKDTLAGNALGAASSLGLIEAGREKATLAAGLEFADSTALADFVHDRLSLLKTGETDSPILEAYAWLAAESDRKGGIGWIFELGREQFADAANTALVGEDDDGRLMNTTKVVAWRRWLLFLGLGTQLPVSNVPDFPSPTARLLRELERANSLGTSMPAEQFLTVLSSRMPYLDRGRLFIQACERIGHTPSHRRLSPFLSIALRDLHEEGALKLNLSGDASSHVQLAQDPAHGIDAFTSVNIFSESLQ